MNDPAQATHVRYGKKYHPLTLASEVTTRELEAWGERSHPVWFNGKLAKNGLPIKHGKMYVVLYNFALGRQSLYWFDAPPITVKTITILNKSEMFVKEE